MKEPRYLHLKPGDPPPSLGLSAPFKAVIVIEGDVAPDWQMLVCDWLVRSGCRYAMAWGHKCSEWHDNVDLANLKVFDFGEIPEEDFVTTTWHDDETLSDVFWFSEHAAFHDSAVAEPTHILHIAAAERSAGLLQTFREAQSSPI